MQILKTDLGMAMIRTSREVRRCGRTSLRVEPSGLMVLRGGDLPVRTGQMETDCLFSRSVDGDKIT